MGDGVTSWCLLAFDVLCLYDNEAWDGVCPLSIKRFFCLLPVLVDALYGCSCCSKDWEL